MRTTRNINSFITLKAELIACLKAEGMKENWVLPHLKAIGLFNFRVTKQSINTKTKEI